MEKDLKISQEAELKLLRERLAAAEVEKERLIQENKNNSAFNEIENIRKRGKSTSGHIQYKDTKDYVPVVMWQVNGIDVGRPRGPFHPTNAEDAFLRFSKIGIILSVRKPSVEDIEKYKATDEYKKLSVQEEKRRKLKDRSRKESEVEKLTKAIADMAGIDPKEVNRIKRPEEVGAKR